MDYVNLNWWINTINQCRTKLYFCNALEVILDKHWQSHLVIWEPIHSYCLWNWKRCSRDFVKLSRFMSEVVEMVFMFTDTWLCYHQCMLYFNCWTFAAASWWNLWNLKGLQKLRKKYSHDYHEYGYQTVFVYLCIFVKCCGIINNIYQAWSVSLPQTVTE